MLPEKLKNVTFWELFVRLIVIVSWTEGSFNFATAHNKFNL